MARIPRVMLNFVRRIEMTTSQKYSSYFIIRNVDTTHCEKSKIRGAERTYHTEPPSLRIPTSSIIRKYSSKSEEDIDQVTFTKVSEETLDSLYEYFEEILERSHLSGADVSYSNGVLSVNLGPTFGIYVVNRQSPNKQIWLSSPTSGPKRYDYVKDEKCWTYKHDGRTLHELLQYEIERIISNVDFSKCLYCKIRD